MSSNPFRPPAPSHNSFLPEDYIRSKAETRANIITLTLFAIVLGAVMGAFVVTKSSVQQVAGRKAFVNQQFKEAGQKIEQLKLLESQQAQMMEKASITAALIEKVPRWALLAEITFRMPAEMRLDSLVVKSTRLEVKPPEEVKPTGVKSLTGKAAAKIKGEKPKEPEKPKPQAPRFTYLLTLEGSAVRNQDVADFHQSLKTSPVLDRVELSFIRDAKENKQDLRKFQFTAAVRSDLNTEELASSLKKLIAERTTMLAGEKAAKESAPGAGGTKAPAAASATEKE